MSEPMMTATELSLIRTARNGATLRVRMRRIQRQVDGERREAALLWQQAIDPVCGVNLALMLIDRCVDCLVRAKALELVLDSRHHE